MAAAVTWEYYQTVSLLKLGNTLSASDIPDSSWAFANDQYTPTNNTRLRQTLPRSHQPPAVPSRRWWRRVSISDPATVPSSMSVRVLSLSRSAVPAVLARYFKLTYGSLVPALLPDCYKVFIFIFRPHVPPHPEPSASITTS